MSFTDIGITINDWIKYNPNVGTEMLHISGLPGWGKTSLAHTLVLDCAKEKEHWILVGDRFCEWRHFHKYSSFFDDITIIIPKGIELFYHGKLLLDWKDDQNPKVSFIEVDYSQLNILDFLPVNKKTHCVVVYDAHLKINERVWLWAKITQQLLDRTIHLFKAIGILFNEAGRLLPQNAQGDHWKAVSEFSDLIIDARQGLVRFIYVSQMQNEIESTIRKKCIWKAHRKGWPARDEPKPVRDSAPFLARNQYHLTCGGLYVKNNSVDKFIEEKAKLRMIPNRSSIDKNGAARSESYTKSEKRVEKSFNFERAATCDARYSFRPAMEAIGAQEGDNIRFTIEKLASVSEK